MSNPLLCLGRERSELLFPTSASAPRAEDSLSCHMEGARGHTPIRPLGNDRCPSLAVGGCWKTVLGGQSSLRMFATPAAIAPCSRGGCVQWLDHTGLEGSFALTGWLRRSSPRLQGWMRSSGGETASHPPPAPAGLPQRHFLWTGHPLPAHGPP